MLIIITRNFPDALRLLPVVLRLLLGTNAEAVTFNTSVVCRNVQWQHSFPEGLLFSDQCADLVWSCNPVCQHDEV